MMTKHFEPKKAHLWQDLLELSLILPAGDPTTEKTAATAKTTDAHISVGVGARSRSLGPIRSLARVRCQESFLP